MMTTMKYGDDASQAGQIGVRSEAAMAAHSVGRRKESRAAQNGIEDSDNISSNASESESFHSSVSVPEDHARAAPTNRGNNKTTDHAQNLAEESDAAVEESSGESEDEGENEGEINGAVASGDDNDDNDDDAEDDDDDDSESGEGESISSTAVQDGKNHPEPTPKRKKMSVTPNNKTKPNMPPPQDKFQVSLEDDNNSLLDTIAAPTEAGALVAEGGAPSAVASNGSKKQLRELEKLEIPSMLPGESAEQFAARKQQKDKAALKAVVRRGRKKKIRKEDGDTTTPKNTSKATNKSGKKEASAEVDFVVREIPVGTRVYCEYPLDRYWYWGVVTNRIKRKYSRFFLYDVKFDDGDTAQGLSVSKMVTEKELNEPSEPQEKRQKRAYNKKTKVAEEPVQAKAETVQTIDKAYTPHELWQKRCKTCPNCLKPDCLKCVCCLGNKRNPDPDTRNCCLQKMCHLIEMPLKAQQAPHPFPKGWRFAFDDTVTKSAPTATSIRHMEGLIIYPAPPNTRRYFLVEKAKNHNFKILGDVDAGEFYKYVGLSNPQQQLGGVKPPQQPTQKPAKKRSQDTEEPVVQVVKKSRKDIAHEATVNSQVDMLRDLFVRRCKNCLMCIKPTCKNCSACKRNSSAMGQRIVCYQKMCLQIAVDKKAQDALGLPGGWKFFYTDPKYVSWYSPVDNTGLAGLVLQSPAGVRYPTVDAAAPFLGSSDAVKNMAAIFYDHIGCIIQPKNPLQGKGFRQKWVDVEGKIQVIYGRIAHVKSIDKAGKHYTVEFDPESRALVNSSNPPNGIIAPERQCIAEVFAFGGCLDFDPKVVPTHTLPFYCSWNVPDFIHETYDTDDIGMFAPRLTIHYRGFQLIIQAKASTIPNAGKGVFISCTSLLGRGRNLILRTGELLDLGVYAPFQPQDTKKNHTFNLKNFLFSSICGEWTFDTTFDGDAYLFDITDNQTGQLHDIAKRHIPAYVNETDGVENPSITAQHDAAGSVHYLLGHYEEEHGPLTIAADGVPREVFIDYGENYEDFRIRKNYSRLPPEQSESRLRELLENDHLEELDQLSRLNTEEVADCIDFLEKDWYNPNRQYPVSVVARALLALLVLKQRLNEFIDSLPPDEMHIGPLHNTKLGPRAKLDVPSKKAQRLVQCLYKYWNCCYRFKDSLVGDKVYTSSLEKILRRENIEEMSAEELEAAIMGI